jgi:hypothetical protein
LNRKPGRLSTAAAVLPLIFTLPARCRYDADFVLNAPPSPNDHCRVTLNNTAVSSSRFMRPTIWKSSTAPTWSPKPPPVPPQLLEDRCENGLSKGGKFFEIYEWNCEQLINQSRARGRARQAL